MGIATSYSTDFGFTFDNLFDIVTRALTKIITVNGIILGFTGVSVFYYLRSVREEQLEVMKKISSPNQTGKVEKELEEERKELKLTYGRGYHHFRSHLSKFIKIYVKVCITCLILGVASLLLTGIESNVSLLFFSFLISKPL